MPGKELFNCRGESELIARKGQLLTSEKKSTVFSLIGRGKSYFLSLELDRSLDIRKKKTFTDRIDRAKSFKILNLREFLLFLSLYHLSKEKLVHEGNFKIDIIKRE